MWVVDNFKKALEVYVDHLDIDQIIIIDNNKKARPNWNVLSHPKILMICYGQNIYVNPAWNEGHKVAKSKVIGLINDDVHVQAEVFDMVLNFNLKVGDLIGVNLCGKQSNYKIDDYIDTQEEIIELKYDPIKAIGEQAWAFGICMFMLKETYTPIPSLYKVWYGDDFLVQKAKRVFAINSNKIKGRISETLVKFNNPDSDISKRIVLDSKNFLRFRHFKHADSYSLPDVVLKLIEVEQNIFETEYQKAKLTLSDINENVHLLYELAKECKTAVEMGVRSGVSTRALLNTDVALTSFDLVLNQDVKNLFEIAQSQGKNVRYIQANVLDIEIKPVDLLFIDTYHTYDQLKKELSLHAHKVNKYIAFHDTHTFGLRGEDSEDNKGLLTAIIEFVVSNPEWKFKIHRTNNNGFTVLEKIK